MNFRKKINHILFFTSIIFLNSCRSIFASDSFGTVNSPLGGEYADFQTGITKFISVVVNLITIIAGLYALINFLLAGLQFISSQGDSKATAEAWNKIYNSVIGLVVIAVAFALTALISYLLFGNAGYILNPEITGPGIGIGTT